MLRLTAEAEATQYLHLSRSTLGCPGVPEILEAVSGCVWMTDILISFLRGFIDTTRGLHRTGAREGRKIRLNQSSDRTTSTMNSTVAMFDPPAVAYRRYLTRSNRKAPSLSTIVGLVEMRLRYIAYRYVTTWFLPAA